MFLLLLVNVALFVLDQVMHVSFVKDLYLNHMRPRWWQFFTSIFCHANYAHLSGNVFFLYVFGNIVEQEEGAFGVWFSYLFTGVGAARPKANDLKRTFRRLSITVAFCVC